MKTELRIALGQAILRMKQVEQYKRCEREGLPSCLAAIELAEKAFHDLPFAEQWQPIENAPKDGIHYLGMIVGDRFYGEPFVCYYDEDEGHICLHQTEARLHRPTHWIAFPKPPTELTTEDLCQ
jgi:hypothetical protein